LVTFESFGIFSNFTSRAGDSGSSFSATSKGPSSTSATPANSRSCPKDARVYFASLPMYLLDQGPENRIPSWMYWTRSINLFDAFVPTTASGIDADRSIFRPEAFTTAEGPMSWAWSDAVHD